MELNINDACVLGIDTSSPQENTKIYSKELEDILFQIKESAEKRDYNSIIESYNKLKEEEIFKEECKKYENSKAAMLTKEFAHTVDKYFNLVNTEDNSEFGGLKFCIISTKKLLNHQKDFFVILNLLTDYNII